MRLRSPEQLESALERDLAPCWLVSGDEPLLAGEAADAIRARARAAGYLDRELFIVEPRFDWGPVAQASRALSLFAERRILEIRLPSIRPGAEGAATLAALAGDPPPDTLVLVICPRIEREVYNSAWFKAFESRGHALQCWPVEIGRLPAWLQARARRHDLALDAAAARLLAERVEGNLLAAHQELEKLALLHPAGTAIGEPEVAAAVASSARYDVFQLGDAALGGDLPRALRILDGLRAEGIDATLVLWLLCRELRALAEARAGTAPGYGAQAEQRAALLRRALARRGDRPLGPLFRRAGRIDRQIKGRAPGDPWASLARLVAALAGTEFADRDAA